MKMFCRLSSKVSAFYAFFDDGVVCVANNVRNIILGNPHTDRRQSRAD